LTLLEKKQPELAGEKRERLAQRENRLVVLSLVCAAIVLFCTAIATAI
jgi:TnpA family transposase